MVGKGRHQVLAVRSVDPVLSLAAAVGLTGSMGTGLVVDLTRRGGAPGERSLRDLVTDGPTLAELSPGRPGVALIPGGAVETTEAVGVIERLSDRWPTVVVRVDIPIESFPTVPVIPLYPGRLLQVEESRGVWQPLGSGDRPPGPGPVLPRLRPSVLRRILAGNLPRKSRWVAAWRRVWDLPWA